MIERYTRPEMGAIWAPEQRFEHMLEVEKAVAEAQAEQGIIPKSAAREIRTKGKFRMARIHQIEKTTRHDVIAFVSAVAENVGKNGRYIHYGMTSSDVLDTAMSVQVKEAANVLRKSMDKLERVLSRQAKKYQDTLCAGRTHGMHAEPTSFGLKLAGFLAELRRNRLRFERATNNMMVGKLSGAVGTYSTQNEKIEKSVCKKLGLKPETIATQVIPRDRHNELFWALSSIACGLERMAVEFRHLQRTEVNEVLEGFKKGQKGSSAMPHKKNPISSENITGAARTLRSYAHAAMENVALWHERDISHSSVERVIFPDAFILCDYIVDRMADVVSNLIVNKDQMIKNMQLSGGQLFSSHVLLALVDKGLAREVAYRLVQKNSHGLKPGDSLYDQLLKDKQVMELVSKKELEKIFSGETHLKAIRKVVRKVVGSKSSKGKT